GALSSSRTDSLGGLGSLFSIQEGSVDVLARRGIQIESVINPTTLTQLQGGSAFQSYFLSYAPESRLRARSATGDITLLSELGSVGERLGSYLGETVNVNDPVLFSLLPPSVFFEATDGDIHINASETYMAPSDRGQLELFARRDIVTPPGFGSLTMSDASAATMPSKNRPQTLQNFVIDLISGGSARHVDDDAPVLINAGRDILRTTFYLPKFAQFSAGRDIRNAGMTAQNVRDEDATLISAGRDLIFDRTSGNRQIQIGGPGRLDIIAGRDVDLGFSTGISSVGRLVNPALPTEKGADITVLAGAGAAGSGALDLAAFMTTVISPSATYREALQKFVAGLTGVPSGDFAAASAQFSTLAEDLQRAFMVPVFFAELVTSGREVNTIPGTGFD
ncbi:MAG: hypothetical protein ABUL69_03865, partial [Peristeroidobacter soli]